MDKWIFCRERLPEICEEDCSGNITFSNYVLTYSLFEDGSDWIGIDKYTTNGGGCWLSEVPFEDPAERSIVIAWMPLPAPPEVE